MAPTNEPFASSPASSDAAPFFAMSKWYLDCVTTAGEALVIYAAEARIGPLRLRHGSILRAPPGQKTWTCSTLAPGAMPEESAGDVRWDCAPLQLSGAWETVATPVHQRLLATDSGALDWHCLQPRSRVRLALGDEWIEGNGYAERLEISLNPWQLPLDELRWGRFHGADGGSLVWIIWKGAHPLTLVFRDGREELNAAADETGLRMGDTQLRLGREHVLRRGRLADTTIPFLPQALQRWLPQSILNLHEQKWSGQSTLCRNGASLPGRAIHEIVNFPKDHE